MAPPVFTGGSFIKGPAVTRKQRQRVAASAAFAQGPAAWAAISTQHVAASASFFQGPAARPSAMAYNDDDLVLEMLART